jgi:hypothetical protein
MLQKGYLIDTPESIQNELMKKARPRKKGVSPPLLLTYPITDLEGDFVVPHGGTWKKNLNVNWNHEHPIGTSYGSPELLTTTINGKEEKLPVGYTRFFQKASDFNNTDLSIRDSKDKVIGKYDVNECLQIAEQAEKLVNNRIVTGVSIEFYPIKTKPIGKSALRGGNAFRVDEWEGVGWAHTPMPINPGAQMLAEKALKVVSDPKTHPIIKKSLSFAMRLQNKTWSNGVSLEENMKKAINNKDFGPGEDDDRDTGSPYGQDDIPDQDSSDDGSYVPDAPAEPGDDKQPTGAVKSMMDIVQLINDVCKHYELSMKQSDNPVVRKNAKKHCDLLMKVAKVILKEADGLHQELSMDSSGDQGTDDSDMDADDMKSQDDEPSESYSPPKDHDDGSGEEMEEPNEGEEPEEDEDDGEIETDETGKIRPKSFPNVKTYRLEPMNQSDFKELMQFVSKKSCKSNTEEELKKAKRRIAELESENNKAKNLIIRFKELKDLGKL